MILCEVRNIAIMVDGIVYQIGTVKEFDEALVKQKPDVLFPVSKNEQLENDFKAKYSIMADKVHELEQENVKLLYAKSETEKTVDKLQKALAEKLATIELLEGQLKELKSKKVITNKEK